MQDNEFDASLNLYTGSAIFKRLCLRFSGLDQARQELKSLLFDVQGTMSQIPAVCHSHMATSKSMVVIELAYLSWGLVCWLDRASSHLSQ